MLSLHLSLHVSLNLRELRDMPFMAAGCLSLFLLALLASLFEPANLNATLLEVVALLIEF